MRACAGAIVGISCGVLLLLYLFQFTGTNYLGWAFSPIVILWLVFNMCIGIYNIVHWYPGASSSNPEIKHSSNPEIKHALSC